MKIKMSFMVALLAAVLMAQSVVGEENEESDYLDIQYPGIFSRVFADLDTPVALATPRRCNNQVCLSRCRALNYRHGRCISSNVCRCSN